jgi:hypothetical protein
MKNFSFLTKRKELKQVRATALQTIRSLPNIRVGLTHFNCHRCSEALYQIWTVQFIKDVAPSGEVFNKAQYITFGYLCARCQEVERGTHGLYGKTSENQKYYVPLTEWVDRYWETEINPCVQCAHPDYDGFHTCKMYSQEVK